MFCHGFHRKSGSGLVSNMPMGEAEAEGPKYRPGHADVHQQCPMAPPNQPGTLSTSLTPDTILHTRDKMVRKTVVSPGKVVPIHLFKVRGETRSGQRVTLSTNKVLCF